MILFNTVPTGETGTSPFSNNNTETLQSSTSSSSSWPAFQTQPNEGLLFGQQTQQQPTLPPIGTIGGLFGTTASFTGTFGGGIAVTAIATRKLKRKSCFGTDDIGPVATSTNSGAIQTGTVNVIAKFVPPIGSDSMLLNRKQTSVSTKMMCIAGMAEYKNKSFEELRMEDYRTGRSSAAAIGYRQQPQQADAAIPGGLFASPLAFETTSFDGPSGATISVGRTNIDVFTKFVPPIGSDSMLLNREQTQFSTKMMCIAGMAEYKFYTKSLEELRLQDYLAGKRVAVRNSSTTAQEQQPQQAGTIAGGLFRSQLAIEPTASSGLFRGGPSGETTSFATTITTTAAAINASSTSSGGSFETINPPAVDVGSIAWPSGDFLFGQKQQPLATDGLRSSNFGQGPQPFSINGEQPQLLAADGLSGIAPSTTNVLESAQPTVGNRWRQLVKDTAKKFGNAVANHFRNMFSPDTISMWEACCFMLCALLLLNKGLKEWKAAYGRKQPCLANIGNGSWDREGSESAVFVDNLTAVNIEGPFHTNIRTREPFSMLDAALEASQCRPIFYFELLIQKNKEHIDFGLSGPDFHLLDGDNWVGRQADSFGIASTGALWQSGTENKGYGEEFGEGDVVGCGLLLLVDGRQLRRQLFFTKNGHIYGEPIWLPKDVSSSLYPTVGLAGAKSAMTAVEANFGANLLLKPFRYDWGTYDTGNSQ